jgi:chromosome segregation and condensation protein ScpB
MLPIDNDTQKGVVSFATTEAFLQRFGLANLQELTATSVSATPSSIQPFI